MADVLSRRRDRPFRRDLADHRLDRRSCRARSSSNSTGEFDGKASAGSLSVVEGLGEGDLEGIRGSGSFRAPGGADATYELDYQIAEPAQVGATTN